MTDKYMQLKKNMKHMTEIYSEGILTATVNAARIAIIDLQEELKVQNEEFEKVYKYVGELQKEFNESDADAAKDYASMKKQIETLNEELKKERQYSQMKEKQAWGILAELEEARKEGPHD